MWQKANDGFQRSKADLKPMQKTYYDLMAKKRQKSLSLSTKEKENLQDQIDAARKEYSDMRDENTKHRSEVTRIHEMTYDFTQFVAKKYPFRDHGLEQDLYEKKKKKKIRTKITKPGKKRVSKKIGYLVDKEKKDPKQAAAIAYSMERRGELKET